MKVINSNQPDTCLSRAWEIMACLMTQWLEVKQNQHAVLSACVQKWHRLAEMTFITFKHSTKHLLSPRQLVISTALRYL